MGKPDLFIFVCGSSRSGTTMVSRILGNHPRVFAFQELHYFDELAPVADHNSTIPHEKSLQLFSTLKAIQRDGYFGKRDWKKYAAETESDVSGGIFNPTQLLLEFMAREAERNGKSIPCEQTPQSVFAMDLILQNVPNARFVVMVRDPREVLLSQKGKWKRRRFSGGKIPWIESLRSRINYHPSLISSIWKATYQVATKHEHDQRVKFIRYEDLTDDPEKTVHDLCIYLGLPFEQSMLDIPRVGSSNIADDGVGRGIDKSLKGKWRTGLNVAEVALCEKKNEKMMRRFGYDLSAQKPSRLLLFFYQLILPLQLMGAVLLNLKRLQHFKKHLQKFTGNSIKD